MTLDGTALRLNLCPLWTMNGSREHASLWSEDEFTSGLDSGETGGDGGGGGVRSSELTLGGEQASVA